MIKQVQMPDGSIVKVDAPDGTSDDDVMRFAAANYKPAAPTPKQVPVDTPKGMTTPAKPTGTFKPKPIDVVGQLKDVWSAPLGMGDQAKADLEKSSMPDFLKKVISGVNVGADVVGRGFETANRAVGGAAGKIAEILGLPSEQTHQIERDVYALPQAIAPALAEPRMGARPETAPEARTAPVERPPSVEPRAPSAPAPKLLPKPAVAEMPVPKPSTEIVPAKPQTVAEITAGDGAHGPPMVPQGSESFHWPDRGEQAEGAEAPINDKKIFEMGRNLDDILYRVSKNAEADTLEARQFLEAPDRGVTDEPWWKSNEFSEHEDPSIRALTTQLQGEKFPEGVGSRPHWKDPAFQERAYNEIESLMIKGRTIKDLSNDVKEFLASEFGRWYVEQHDLYKLIKDSPEGKEVMDPDRQLPDVTGGYVHRIPKGKGSQFDDPGDFDNISRDPIARGRTRSLSAEASALHGRKFFVIEGPDGQRVFMPREMATGRSAKGEEIMARDPKTGRQKKVGPAYPGRIYKDGYVAREATTDEIEKGTATGKYGYTKPVKYFKNLMVNTIENTLRLRRVYRAIKLTTTLKDQLERMGLLYRGDQIKRAPNDFIQPRLPQFNGTRVHPTLAYSLDDFAGGSPEDPGAVDFIERMNGLLTKAIFYNPIPHIQNVAAFWAANRAIEWFRPKGWSSLFRNGVKAIQDVNSGGPVTKAMLRAGAGLQHPRIANENFFKLMAERMGKEIIDDPQTWHGLFKSMGIAGGDRTPVETMKDFVRIFYKTAQKTMWQASDYMMTQRVMELVEQKAPLDVAIKRAERDIPNYRIPSQIWRSKGTIGRGLSKFLQSNNYIMFGRYKFDQFKFITNLARDLLKGNDEERQLLLTSGEDPARLKYLTTTPARMEALAKATFIVGMATVGFKLGDAALQWAVGNKDAKVRRPGFYALFDDVEQYISGGKDWAQTLGAIFSVSPFIDKLQELISNKDQFGRDIWKEGQSVMGHIVGTAEYAAGSVAPIGQIMNMFKPGGTKQTLGRQVGLDIPPAGSKAKQRKYRALDRKRNRKAEMRDPIEKGVKNILKEIGL